MPSRYNYLQVEARWSENTSNAVDDFAEEFWTRVSLCAPLSSEKGFDWYFLSDERVLQEKSREAGAVRDRSLASRDGHAGIWGDE